jgi:hypothetical protein
LTFLKASLYNEEKGGYFMYKIKQCESCGNEYEPTAACSRYCSEPCRKKGYASKYYQRTYGLTIGEVEALLKKSNNKCYICQSEGFSMKECHRSVLVVDHNHKTGAIRGMLCHNCNRALGLLQDSEEILEKALKYIQQEGAETIRKEYSSSELEAPSPQ